MHVNKLLPKKNMHVNNANKGFIHERRKYPLHP